MWHACLRCSTRSAPSPSQRRPDCRQLLIPTPKPLPPCSASATQQNTSNSLGASAAYDGVSGGANTEFGRSMSQQSASSSAATLFQCNAAAFAYNLKSFAIMDSSALDSSFYASTVALIQVGTASGVQPTTSLEGYESDHNRPRGALKPLS